MPRYTILPAEKADLPRMNEISRDCFLDDSHTLFKVHEKGDPDNSKELAGDHLIPLLDNPNAKIIKVVDEETGFLAGWSAWYFFNYDGSRTGNEEDQRNREQGILDEPGPPADAPPYQHLGHLTSQHMQLMQVKLCPLNIKTMFIIGISVDPKVQGKGIGSMMLQWAGKKADEDKVKIWVHSSEAGWPVFKKNGFEEVERLTVDLDEYATKKRIVDGKEEKWGSYTFRYMLRDPRQRGCQT